MRPLNFPLHPVTRACAATALFGALATFGPSAFAATAAGTQIKNLATVTYEDAAGNVYSAQSNEAIVTVAQVYFATVGTDIDVTAAPGQTVYLPYVLTNTGNGTDNYDVSAVDGHFIADTLNADSIKVFRDVNGNGQADSGESEVSTLTLAAGEAADLVVAVRIPTTATGTDTVGVTLTAEAWNGTPAAVANSVGDATNLTGGSDSTEGTNQSMISVTSDAVLVTTKTSSHDVGLNEITYTITVSNNGNTAAQNVIIFDGMPADTTYKAGSASVSGLLGTNGDTVATYAPTLADGVGFDLNGDGDVLDNDESLLGVDLNTDGDLLDSGLAGVYAIDAELAPNATVSMTFTVSYVQNTFGGGNTVDNIGHVTANIDGVAGPDGVVSSTNRTSDTVTQDFGVELDDTATGQNLGVNDGGDDDAPATVNDVQLVDTAASGGLVLFNLTVTNTGNGDDTFELSTALGTFPTGTVFTYHDATGSVQLTDTNGFGGADTGVIAQNGTRTIQVRAKLPQGIDGAGPYTATVTATSANDPTGATSNPADITLQQIVGASADLHSTLVGPGPAPEVDSADNSPLGTPDYVPVDTAVANAGDTVNIPLYIDNASGGSDSFQLSVGSTWDTTTLGSLPQGWSVEFFASDGSGNPTGPAITSTPSIPGGTLNYEVIAVVTLPADPALSAADFSSDLDVDLTVETIDQNLDGDGDYPLFFRIVSANSGATDTMLEAVDVTPSRAVAFSPSSSNQVEAGGTVDYPLTLSNNGNSEESLELTTTNSQADFNNTVAIDTTGDGIADTVLGNLVAGTITVLQANGVPVDVVVTISVAGNPVLTIPAGADLPLLATVLAPSTAPAGQTDTMTLVATNTGTGPSSTVSFQTDVINGQVRLTKTVAVDTGCDSAEPAGSFVAVQTTAVEPGECVVWQVIAENQGDVDAKNVKITDSVTAFTTYELGSLYYCEDQGCAPLTVTDGVNADAGVYDGTSIVFYVGTGADPTTSLGGTLVPGQKVTAQFRVRVE